MYDPKSALMKKIYLICLCVLLHFSCSKENINNDTDSPILLKACFTLSKTSVIAGEELEITSCSVDAVSYVYNFGVAGTSVKENPKVTFLEEGNYTISLTVKDAKQNIDTFTKSVLVSAPVSPYFYPTLPVGLHTFPLHMGINPINNKRYSVVVSEDLSGVSGAKFYFNELEENNSTTPQYIADKQFNTKNAFVNFLSNGDKNFNFSRTLPDFYGSQEITLNSTWGILNSLNSASKLNYGSISDGSNFIYYGTQKDGDFYTTAIEKRNPNGDIFEVVLNSLSDSDSMFGALIKSGTGYIAFGGVFIKNSLAPQISGYKPILVFMDTNFSVLSSTVFENSVLDSKISNADHLNSKYTLIQLTNGNLVMYTNGELLISDMTGNLIAQHYFEGTNNPQALISLGNSFILSTKEYLKKFDAQGTFLKELKYPGTYLPSFTEINNQLFFVAGYDTQETVEGLGSVSLTKILYGLVDKELNPINLNQ